MLDLRLFRNPRFSAASLAVTALYFCLFGTIFFQTQHLQFVLGYDPLGAGLRSLPFAVVLLVVANTTPRLVARLGTRAVITTGLLIVAASMAGRVGFTTHTTYTGDPGHAMPVRPGHGPHDRAGDRVGTARPRHPHGRRRTARRSRILAFTARSSHSVAPTVTSAWTEKVIRSLPTRR